MTNTQTAAVDTVANHWTAEDRMTLEPQGWWFRVLDTDRHATAVCPSEQDAQRVANALNAHDALQAEVAKLREALRSMIDHQGGYYSASSLFVETRDLDAARALLAAPAKEPTT